MKINATSHQNVAQDAALEDIAQKRNTAIISACQLGAFLGAMKMKIAAISAVLMVSARKLMHAHLSHLLGSSGSSAFQEVSSLLVLLSALSCVL